MKSSLAWLNPVRERSLVVALTALVLLQFLTGCDYARMKDDDAINTYQISMPEMPKKTIPTTGGIQTLREANPDNLKNPLADSAETIARGRERYGFYCMQCHGPLADGHGTVGQSFAPLPANLKSSDVQEQDDGWLFHNINLGINRHPPLWDTVAAEDVWAILWYLRSLAEPAKG